MIATLVFASSEPGSWTFGWDALVAIGTLALAGYTARLATKTSTLADETKIEVQHSAKLAEKAQEQVNAATEALKESRAQTVIAQRTLDAQYRPVLIGVGRPSDPFSTDLIYPGEPTAAQARDDQIIVSVIEGDARVSLPLRNVGSGSALITGAVIDTGTQQLSVPVALQFATVPPDESARLNFRAWPGQGAYNPLSDFLSQGKGFAVVVSYTDVGGQQAATSSFALERATGNWRLKNVAHTLVGRDDPAASADFISNL